jgi:uncharacterized DUF497 family protein
MNRSENHEDRKVAIKMVVTMDYSFIMYLVECEEYISIISDLTLSFTS